MGHTVLSREGAQKVIDYSEEARDNLVSNMNILDYNVNRMFSGLTDPTFRRYLELSEKMQSLLKKVGNRMDDVSKYCQELISFIDIYMNM